MLNRGQAAAAATAGPGTRRRGNGEKRSGGEGGTMLMVELCDSYRTHTPPVLPFVNKVVMQPV